MTQRIVLPRLGTGDTWRASARECLSAQVHPRDVTWADRTDGPGLFDNEQPQQSQGTTQVTVPKAFLSLAQSVVWHSDNDRFDRLYGVLWRLQDNASLIHDRADQDLAHLRRMEKAVLRCQHKMKAFVRFREIGDGTAQRRSFAAWFEPTHNTMEPTAQFFAKRFGDMDWRIVTPTVSAIFEGGKLTFKLDLPRAELPADAHEDLWTTYFCNIFNPARLKVSAMTSEMPKKYWKNLPEATMIPSLIADAPARSRAMAEAMPTLPPARTARVQAAAQRGTHWDGPSDAFDAALAACTRCPLHSCATQVVPGVGPKDARLMIVGEQPSDTEDLTGEPFVGPAGKLLEEALTRCGIDPADLYLTNAVKHYNHVARGKRRIHQTPTRSHIEHCKFWLESEIVRVKPRIIVALGRSAAGALTGRFDNLTQRRGKLEVGRNGLPVLITWHPAHVLRMPDFAKKESLRRQLQDDLSLAFARSAPNSLI